MGRRKRVIDDPDDSDSVSGSDTGDFGLEQDPDAREERALFENPYQRKRRRGNGKDDAIYGVFGDDSEDEGFRDRKRGSGAGRPRSDWTKAPAFVSGDKRVDLEQAMDVELEEKNAMQSGDDGDDGEDDGSGDEVAPEEEVSDDSEPSRPPSPRIRVDEEELPDRPQFGGIGLSTFSTLPSFSKGGIGSSNSNRPASGSNDSQPKVSTPGLRGGIGSHSSTAPSTSAAELPSAFAKRSQPFIRDATPTAKPVQLSATERAHFSRLQGSFGARMLAKMGWEAGTGLGAEGEGIVTPVESKLRPQKIGIAFKGFKERTEQSKMEARRKGLPVSDDEEDIKVKKFKKKMREQEEKRSDVWKRPKKVKMKIEHKTYEQIISEAGQDHPSVGVGQIIDATGAVPREVSSLADLSLNSWAPSNDPTRIPEVRHNIRIIADTCKSDLDGLAREAKALEERKKWVMNEDSRLRRKIEQEAQLIARLQQVQLVANDINSKSKELASVYEVSLDPLSPLFDNLMDVYAHEFERYGLDELVVAAIAPLVRRIVASWNPMEDPTQFIATFRTWRRVLKINVHEKPPDNRVNIYGPNASVAPVPEVEKPMTPFESLLWNVWLPRVRTTINNDWSPEDPQPAVRFYDAWATFLPPFIRDNILDQLILPKVQKAVADWNQKKSTSLRAIVFPWLPHVGLRLEEFVSDARRKVKSLLRSWVVGEDIPTDLATWKEIFDTNEWDNMLLKYVVPKLGATLRTDFRINPRDQKMEPLQRVLLWSDLVRPSIFAQILETEFFPKWLEILHVWLIQPKVNFAEMAQWYSFWKDSFPENVHKMGGVNQGFTRGLQLMNKAIELGPNAPTQLARPDFHAELLAANAPQRNTAPKPAQRTAARTHEITFRAIVEEFAASHNLLFIATGRAHERSRMPLFRVSPTADGKGGLLVYILDDAVWAAKDGTGGEAEEYRAISLDDMVQRATNS